MKNLSLKIKVFQRRCGSLSHWFFIYYARNYLSSHQFQMWIFISVFSFWKQIHRYKSTRFTVSHIGMIMRRYCVLIGCLVENYGVPTNVIKHAFCLGSDSMKIFFLSNLQAWESDSQNNSVWRISTKNAKWEIPRILVSEYNR